MTEKKVRTRFAPSPTGSMHIGNLRTAFYAYALSKHEGGDFILRIEDTDKKREVEGGMQEIKNILTIFGINWDEYYLQSERLDLYKVAAEKLVKDGHAFYCQCEAKNAKQEGFSSQLRDSCRDKNFTSGAIKLKVPENEIIKFRDFVLGEEIEWKTEIVFDATLLKSDKFPTYHLAVVVDDHATSVSHVLRGHDWLPSTPIHLLVYKYLDFKIPQIGHLTDILDPDGGKLSKRKGSTSVTGLLEEGYLPEALFNFVILAGWAPKDNRELFSLEDFVNVFDASGFQKSNPIFNRDKLDWFNGQYIRKTNDSELTTRILKFYKEKYPEDLIEKIVPLIKDRITRLSDFDTLAGFFFKESEVDKNLLGDNFDKHLHAALETLLTIKDFNNSQMNDKLLETVKNNNFKTGDFFMDLRIAITGKKMTPPINESLVILGKEETLKRIKQVLKSTN
ncbi:glutamate--tRNA ligase [Candidatus Woesebacteria bacterium RIFCSPHIGHO2_12_FULL_38_9]|uniref:Glutamate--tRNA ligase n=1 Tax=Candidatus Woesebacteria bacterium RIFCSPHIGHO2_01_FULL_40_22 TaxID=1802499 RepID=A0A1F7YKP9_9BACT|nr:MAG: glutamate--tRNA ligase [Candidatus Woesebacteria bacterium RIFCSPHIGHO2_01_FULL_40_22]OGM37538.1 MAG: glutamate--tRNA ligase [Candidatus Woesebacteria bacterium RIFCSPHIGHO2_12_FULL_38_9]